MGVDRYPIEPTRDGWDLDGDGLDLPIEKLDANTRIKVAVNIFGRATPVELEYWQVAKA